MRCQPALRRALLLAHLVLACLAAALLAAAIGPARPVGSTGPSGLPVTYEPPVVAPVVDPYRAPSTPYGAGNRGIEYATAAGSPVGAAADGVVTFAGTVAGSRYVTVSHADGVRTSVGPLARILVHTGDRVERGQPLGLSGARLHVGARRRGAYLDPASLWTRRRAILVPTDGRRQGRRDGAGRWTPWSGWWAEEGARLASPDGPPTGEPHPTSTRIHPNGRLQRR